MALAIEISEISYQGNGSTVTAYPVPFPVVSAEHIKAAVTVPGFAEAVLSPSEFGVHLSGGAYSVTTTVAWASTAIVRVFRDIPYDQPFEFPEGNILRTVEIERSQDRIVMQIQQLLRGLLTHTHDGRYYTQEQLDVMLSTLFVPPGYVVLASASSSLILASNG